MLRPAVSNPKVPVGTLGEKRVGWPLPCLMPHVGPYSVDKNEKAQIDIATL